MLCQFCGKHKATNRFLVSFMGQNNEVFICDECLNNFSRYAGIPGRQQVGIQRDKQQADRMPIWPMEFQNSHEDNVHTSESFNVNDVSEIRVKRRLNQLGKQLQDAVRVENYEDAAILRDKINSIRKEVFINGK